MKEISMRLRIVISLIVLSLLPVVTGCSSKNKGKIEGTKWTSLATVMKGVSLPAGSLKFEFRSDGTLVYQVGPITYTGRYSLGMGDMVTMNLDQDLGGRKKHVQRVNINGDRLIMADSDGTEVTFVKA